MVSRIFRPQDNKVVSCLAGHFLFRRVRCVLAFGSKYNLPTRPNKKCHSNTVIDYVLRRCVIGGFQLYSLHVNIKIMLVAMQPQLTFIAATHRRSVLLSHLLSVWAACSTLPDNTYTIFFSSACWISCP